jgi:segregation and condensation protein A
VSLEQLLEPVVYGQQVPSDPAAELPGLPVADSGLPATDAPAADADVPVEDADIPVEDSGKFTVRLDNFTGPFDLLLQLIGKHKLDVTEVALHQVTDDFIAYIRAMGDDWDLDEASEFLLVAATLLDLKAARLLPAADVEDEEDLALLEARDLLFARLLQYKAFKEAAAFIADLEGTGAKRYPRAVSMETRYAEALPDLVLGIGVERLFKLALKQFTPKPGPPLVSIAHIHQARVSVREHAQLLRDRLRRAGSATFSLLVADCENTLEVVARFLALLELYREGLIDFEQPVSLDELTVRWIGGEAADADLDIDDYEGTKPEPDTAAEPLPGDEPDLSNEPDSTDDLDFTSDLDFAAELEPAAEPDFADELEQRGEPDFAAELKPAAELEPAAEPDFADELKSADESDELLDELEKPADEPDEVVDEPTEISADESDLSDESADESSVPAEQLGEFSVGPVADEADGEFAAELDGRPVDEAGGERSDESDLSGAGVGGDSEGGAEGTSGAIVSDSGYNPAGRFDLPVDRRDLGGGEDDSASAVVEERS